MTPEQIAADRIARAVAPSLCVAACSLERSNTSVCKGCIHDAARVGKIAVEDMSAAGLVIMTAERAAELIHAPRWQPIETAPRDGTRCLFYAPANPKANNENAHRPQMRVDLFSLRWPKALHQLPEAPYTHWMPLPAPPGEVSDGWACRACLAWPRQRTPRKPKLDVPSWTPVGRLRPRSLAVLPGSLEDQGERMVGAVGLEPTTR